MIAGWLIKLIVSIAVVGFLGIELGTPLIVRTQLDGLAHDAADTAGAIVRDRGSEADARAAAENLAAKDDATVEEFVVDQQERVTVTLRKQANSYLLKKWDPLKGWYDIKKSATSEGPR